MDQADPQASNDRRENDGYGGATLLLTTGSAVVLAFDQSPRPVYKTTTSGTPMAFLTNGIGRSSFLGCKKYYSVYFYLKCTEHQTRHS